MDKNTKEKKYLQKIGNDINERLYDLLVMHLVDHHKKVRKSGPNKDKMIKLLDKAITNLNEKTNKYNQIRYYRYIIICCNALLTYDTQRQDIKDLKKKIVEDYTHSEPDSGGRIPLNYQINEVRITYDTGYLCYLMEKFVKQKLWDKALYCLITVRLIEPDNEEIDGYYKKIKNNIEDKSLPKAEFKNPRGKILILDSNVVISHIFHDVGNYRIRSYPNFDLELLGNYNEFIVTQSTMKEVQEHLDYELVKAKKICYSKKHLDYEEVEETLKKRFKKLKEKYGCEEVKVESSLIKEIEEFYLEYLEKLEEILLSKIRGRYVSHKLRKLAQRRSMLPEEGDITLLAEAITMNKEKDKEVGILSNDKDFTEFTGGIKKEFGVRVYK